MDAITERALADPRCQEFIDALADIVITDMERRAHLRLLLRESDDTIPEPESHRYHPVHLAEETAP